MQLERQQHTIVTGAKGPLKKKKKKKTKNEFSLDGLNNFLNFQQLFCI